MMNNSAQLPPTMGTQNRFSGGMKSSQPAPLFRGNNNMKNTNGLVPLQKGDFVAVLSKLSDNGVPRWILGQVNSSPFESDVDIRLWEKHRDVGYNPSMNTVNNPEVAELLERIQKAQENLAASIEHAANLSDDLREQRQTILAEIRDAEEYVKESKAIMNAARDDVERIPIKHWQELKSYRVAPQMVSVVLRAVMLLLCEDEARTWPQIQKVLRDINFKSRITSYAAETRLSPERREYIMRECVSRRSFRYDRAMQGSLAIGPIYYWVLAQLDCGEAFVQKHKVDKEKLARQRELRAMLRRVTDQAALISEHHAMMDDLDDEMRALYHKTAESPSLTVSPREPNNSVTDGVVTARYKNSFAGQEGKLYLKPAYFNWAPTDRVLTILRNAVLCNFGPLSEEEATREMESLNDARVHALDDAICQRLYLTADETAEERQARELAEDRRLERNILLKQENSQVIAPVVEEEEVKEDEDEGAEPSQSPQSTTWDSFWRTFDGQKWHGILERRRDEVMRVFAEESSRCLQVPLENVAVNDVSETEPIVVAFEVCHSGRRDPHEMQDMINEYPYPELQSMYDEETAEREEVVREMNPLPAAPTSYHVTGLPPVTFAGVRWEDCLHTQRPEIATLFTVETAEALGVPEDNVILSTIKAGPAGLECFYQVFECPASPTETMKQLSSCPYPRVWALYNQSCAAAQQRLISPGRFEKTFEGVDWRRVVQNRRQDLEDCFLRDESESLRVMPNQIAIRAVHAGEEGLTVRYDVSTNPKLTPEYVNQTEDYPYPNMWALYEDADGVVTSHEIGFEGEGWVDVINTKYSELQRRFVRCTADLLGLKEEDVLRLHFTTGSLFANFDLRHPSFMTEHEINQKLSQCPYLPVWELLPMTDDDENDEQEETENAVPAAEQEAATAATQEEETTQHAREVSGDNIAVVHTTYHELAFEGTPWEEMLSQHEPLVRDAVLRDTLTAVNADADPQDVEIVSLKYAEDSLIVNCKVTSAGGQEVVQDALERYPFDNVWALLLHPPSEQQEAGEEALVPPPRAATTTTSASQPAMQEEEMMAERPTVETRCTKEIECRFPGDDWEAVLQDATPEAVHRAFQEDVAESLGLRPEDIEVVGTRFGSLIVAYRVQNAPPEMTDEELRERLQREYNFPRVQALYRARTGSRISRQSLSVPERPSTVSALPPLCGSRVFAGGEWANLVENHYPAVERAAVRDISDARQCPEDDVTLQQPLTVLPASDPSGPGLFLQFQVVPRNAAEQQWTFTQEVEQYPFPLLNALNRDMPKNMHTDRYTVHFDAEGWAYIVRRLRWELARALSDDSGEACKISSDDIVDCEFHVDTDALTADMCICHDKSISREEMENALFLSPFRRVWEMYELYCPSGLRKREFRGEGWATVNNLKNEELKRAFCNDTAKALDISRLEVEVREIGTNQMGCCITYVVRACPLSAEDIDKRSADYLYPEVWALYELYGRVARHETVNDTKLFAGERWRSIVTTRRQAVSHAFQMDVANALQVPNDAIAVPSMEANEAALTVNYRVNVNDGRTERQIADTLNIYPYPLVWEEYVREGSVSLSDQERVTPDLQRRFEGDRWGSVLQNRRGDVHDAFGKGVADALGVPQSSVEILDARVGSLIVDYRVHNPPYDDAGVDDRVQRHGFPELMALHPATPVPASRDVSVLPFTAMPLIRDHEVGFDGDRWAEVVRNEFDALRDAFCQDTADCLRCSPLSLQSVSFAVSQQMIAYFALNTLQQSSSVLLSPEEVDDRLRHFPFPRVWALYPRAPSVPRVVAPVIETRGVSVPISIIEPANYITTRHAIHFSGDAWGVVAQMMSDRLREAIVGDVAQCLDIPERDITRTMINVEPREALHSVVTVQHSPQLTNEWIKEKMAMFDYPRVWSLYNVSSQSSMLMKFFPGNRWKDILRRNRRGLGLAFQNDYSDMTTLPAPFTVIHEISTGHTHHGSAEEGLIVHYVVQGRWFTDEQLETRASAFPFPQVWAFYQQPSDNLHECRLTFPGELWDSLFTESSFRQDLDAAFFQDISHCFRSVDTVNLKSMKTSPENGGSLDIYFNTSAPQEEYVEARRKTKAYDYPAIWNLYRIAMDRRNYQPPQQMAAAAVPVSRSVSTRDITTRHELTFEGPDWDYVWNNKQPHATEVFEEEVAQAMGVPRNHVSQTRMIPAAQGIILRTCVCHPSSLRNQEIARELEQYPYRRFWSLYERRPQLTKLSTLAVLTFEGPDWEYTMTRRAREVNQAIREETASALRVDKNDVQDVRCQANASGLDIRLIIRKAPLSDVSNLKHYAYSRVWALYMVPDRAVSGNCQFEGDWSYSVQKDTFHNALQHAFTSDVGDALRVNPHSEVELSAVNLDYQNNLVLLYKVHHEGLRSGRVQETLRLYSFPRVWELYQLPPLQQAPNVSGPQTRRFEGDRWGPVLQNRRGDVHDAFGKGVADALGVPQSSVEILDARVGSLIVDYRVHNPPYDDAGVNDRVQRHGFPELMALHPEEPKTREVVPVPVYDTQSALSVYFQGEGWSRVLANKRLALADAFQKDTADAIGLRTADIVVTDLVPSMTIYSTVTHPTYRLKSDLQRDMNAYAYPRVWALYEESERTSLHSVSFTGDNWNAVDAKKHVLLQDTMRSSAARALNLGYDHVHVANTTFNPEQMVALLEVRHPADMSDDSITRTLQNYPFNDVYALYEAKPEPVGVVRLFPGVDWEAVVQQHRSAVRSAFIRDTVDTLGCRAADVDVQSLFTSEKGLSLNYMVQNGVPNESTARAVNSAPYPHVWALYNQFAGQPPVYNSAPPLQSTRDVPPVDRYTSPRSKRFDGADWDIPLYNSRPQLENAFRQDVAESVGVPESSVEIQKMSLGSLVVQYRVRNAPVSEEQVHQRVDRAPFPRVWNLYRPRQPSASIAPSVTPPLSYQESMSFQPTRSPPRQQQQQQQQPPLPMLFRSSQQLQPPATLDPELTSRQTQRRSQQVPPPALSAEEQRAAREAMEAAERAERAKRERDRAAQRAAEVAAEAAREEAEAQRAMEAARQRRAEAEEAARRQALQAEEEEQRRREAEAAAARARQGMPPQALGGEEGEPELDQLTYLRQALAEARSQRDSYASMLSQRPSGTNPNANPPTNTNPNVPNQSNPNAAYNNNYSYNNNNNSSSNNRALGVSGGAGGSGSGWGGDASLPRSYRGGSAPSYRY